MAGMGWCLLLWQQQAALGRRRSCQAPGSLYHDVSRQLLEGGEGFLRHIVQRIANGVSDIKICFLTQAVSFLSRKRVLYCMTSFIPCGKQRASPPSRVCQNQGAFYHVASRDLHEEGEGVCQNQRALYLDVSSELLEQGEGVLRHGVDFGALPIAGLAAAGGGAHLCPALVVGQGGLVHVAARGHPSR